MYAIVEINGQQFKAEEGKKLFVHHIKDVEAGQTVEFDKVLLVDKDGSITVGAPAVEGAKVVVEVVNPLVKGDKVIVFKMKRRKDYRKKNGQPCTVHRGINQICNRLKLGGIRKWHIRKVLVVLRTAVNQLHKD